MSLTVIIDDAEDRYLLLSTLILAKLRNIDVKLENQRKDIHKIMTDLELQAAALKRIDDATTAQGVTLTQEAETLQTISDEIDKFIVTPPAGVDPTFLAALQGVADKTEAVGKSLTAQADFSTQIASKGAVNPVPVPPPPPTP